MSISLKERVLQFSNSNYNSILLNWNNITILASAVPIFHSNIIILTLVIIFFSVTVIPVPFHHDHKTRRKIPLNWQNGNGNEDTQTYMVNSKPYMKRSMIPISWTTRVYDPWYGKGRYRVVSYHATMKGYKVAVAWFFFGT